MTAYKILMTHEDEGDEMSERVDLACTVCTEEFVVPMAVYEAHSGVVICPCCGSTDLVLLAVSRSKVDQAPVAP
jgi:hypothetical protein